MGTAAKLNRISGSSVIRTHRRANHSATHILHEALRQVLGDHVAQKGSLVSPERLRFDFSHHSALSRDELRAVEQLSNEIILQNAPVETRLMAIDDAHEAGAMALFGEKYGDEVRVVSIGAPLIAAHVAQKGSLVSPERLRFDFSHHSALSRDEHLTQCFMQYMGGDTGTIQIGKSLFHVTDTKKKIGDLIVHQGVVEKGSFKPGQTVKLNVDHRARRATRANHSATHILHEALRQVLGDHVAQKGSLVSPDRLRFDFSHHEAVSRDELSAVAQLSNEIILQNAPVQTRLMAINSALSSFFRL